MGVLSLFTNPADAIAGAKRSRSIGTSIVLLVMICLIAAILLHVAPIMPIAASGYGGMIDAGNMVIAILAQFGVFLVLGFVLSVLVGTAIRTLGGSGGFYEGITSLAYSLFVPIFAALMLFVIFLILVFGKISPMDSAAYQTISLIIMVIAMWGTIMGGATFYRALKDLFSTDMITAYVGASLICGIVLLLAVTLGSMMLAQIMGGMYIRSYY